MKLSKDERSELARLRLERAVKSIGDAGLLLKNKSLRGASNRVYYGMFYGISALAIFNGRSFSKHTGLISYFQKEYIKTNIFARNYGRALQKAFKDRTEADYQDYPRITVEDIRQRLKEADDLLKAISNYVKSKSL